MTDVNLVTRAPRTHESPAPAPSRSLSEQADAVILFPEPGVPSGVGGDAIAQIAQLLVQASYGDRASSRKLSDLAEQRIAQETNQRIHDMREAAEAAFVAGVLAGVGQIASGASQIGSACVITDAQSAAIKAASGRSQPLCRSLLLGSGEAAHGLATGWGKAFERKSQEHTANAEFHQAQASTSEREWQKHREDLQSAREVIRRVMEFVEQARQAQQAARSAAVIRG